MHFISIAKLGFVLSAIYPAAAIFRDEVNDIDWHHKLLGLPDASSTHFISPHNRRLLVTLTDLGIIGAVSPADGSMVWRRDLVGDQSVNNTRIVTIKGDEWVVSIAGPEVAAWDSLSGKKVWGFVEAEGHVLDAISEVPGAGMVGVFALVKKGEQYFAIHLNGADGSVVARTPMKTSLTPKRITTINNKAYVVAVSESSIEVIVVDGTTGTTSETFILSSRGDGNPHVLYVGSDSDAPVLVWSHGSANKLFVNHLGSHAKTDITLPATAMQVDVHATVDAVGKAYIVLHTRSRSGNSAVVYGLAGNALKKLYELPSLPGRGTFDAVAVEGAAYIVRITDTEVQVFDTKSADVVTSWPIKLYSDKGIVHSTSDIIKTGDGLTLDMAAVTSVQDWSFLHNGAETWTRNEGLSSAVAATLISESKPEGILKVLDEEAHSNPISAYIHRVTRHIEELYSLPAYLSAIPGRLSEAIYGSKSGVNPVFGFSKTLVVATSRGRVYALDTGDRGRIMWSKQVAPYVPGRDWAVTGVYYNEAEKEVTVVDKFGQQITMSSETGELYRAVHSSGAVLQSSIYDANSSSIITVLDGGSVSVSASIVSDATYVVKGSEGQLKGITVGADGKNIEMWTFFPPAGSSILNAYTRLAHDPVASIGRVLGDRSVLYKYLQPNTAIVTYYSDIDSTLTVVLLDTVSGQTLHSATHIGVDATKDIDCVASENWFACTFFSYYVVNDGTSRQLMGQHLVMTDLYESSTPNDRGVYNSDETWSSFEPVNIPNAVSLPYAVSQAYILNTPLKALSVSQTLQGITRRQLLAYVKDLNAVFGLPREMFDPRRPIGRDPTKDETEAESLPRYQANIELDPKMTISHARDILGIKKILAVPTNMESTSVVVAYGVDLFGTRIAPSQTFDILGKSFDRVSLVGTCTVLLAAVVVLKPMVVGKQIDTVWKM